MSERSLSYTSTDAELLSALKLVASRAKGMESGQIFSERIFVFFGLHPSAELEAPEEEVQVVKKTSK